MLTLSAPLPGAQPRQSVCGWIQVRGRVEVWQGTRRGADQIRLLRNDLVPSCEIQAATAGAAQGSGLSAGNWSNSLLVSKTHSCLRVRYLCLLVHSGNMAQNSAPFHESRSSLSSLIASLLESVGCFPQPTRSIDTQYGVPQEGDRFLGEWRRGIPNGSGIKLTPLHTAALTQLLECHGKTFVLSLSLSLSLPPPPSTPPRLSLPRESLVVSFPLVPPPSALSLTLSL